MNLNTLTDNGKHAPTQSLTSDETLIFIHLMKTGGTSLFRLLRQQYPDDLTFHYVPKKAGKKLEDLQNLGADAIANLKFVHGHLQFGFHEYLTPPSRYITMLREPISRIISLYYFTHQNPNRHIPADRHCPTIASYLDSRRKALNNYQTRTLAGAIATDIEFGHCTDEILTAAKQNLEKFLMVGITERFDESVLVLSHLLNLENILYSRRNENRQRPQLADIASEDIEKIKYYNQLDQELYAYANQLLNAQIRQFGDAFHAEYALYQKVNRQFSQTQTQLIDSRKELGQVRTELGQAYKELEQERNSTFYGKVKRKLQQFLPSH